MEARGWQHQMVFGVTREELERYPEGDPVGPPDGSYVKYEGEEFVYRLQGFERRVRSCDSFVAVSLSSPSDTRTCIILFCCARHTHQGAVG